MVNFRYTTSVGIVVCLVAAAAAYYIGAQSRPVLPSGEVNLSGGGRVSSEAQPYAHLSRDELLTRVVQQQRELEQARHEVRRHTQQAVLEQDELLSAQTRIAELERRQATTHVKDRTESVSADMSDAELEAKVASINQQFARAFSAGERDTVVQLLTELRQLGPRAYPALVARLNEIIADREDANVLGLSRRHYFRLLGRDADFYHYALHDATAHPDLRVGAVHALGWRDGDDHSALFAAQLTNETDEAVIAAIARQLRRSYNEQSLSALAAAVERGFDDERTGDALLFAIAGVQSPSALTMLEQFAADGASEFVQETARAALNMASSPSPGVGLVDIVANSQAEYAGLQKGDVIVRYDGHAVTNQRRLRELVRNTSGNDTITIEYYRDGTISDAQVQGGMLGIRGQRVGDRN